MAGTEFKNDWVERSLLFADGAHGSAAQVHQIGWGRTDQIGLDDGVHIRWTPIVWVWRKKNHDDPGIRRWYYRDQEMPDFNDAARLWREESEPTAVVKEPVLYLDSKRLKPLHAGPDPPAGK